MIRHIALAILLAFIASAPVAAAQTHIGNSATGPAIWHSITSKPTTGSVTTGQWQNPLPFQSGTYRKPGAIEINLPCAYCTGHDGGVGQPQN